jgi:hypothetical protein
LVDGMQFFIKLECWSCSSLGTKLCRMDVGNTRAWGLMCSLVFVAGVLLSISGITNISGISVEALVDVVRFCRKLECSSAIWSCIRWVISSSCNLLRVCKLIISCCSSAIGPLSCGHNFWYFARLFCHCCNRARCTLVSSRAFATVGGILTYAIFCNGKISDARAGAHECT